jgi:hypothetical protein
MEAGSHSGIARLVQQSLGTSTLFPSYVLVIIGILVYYTGILLQNGMFHKCRNTLLQVEAPRQLSLSQKECPSVQPVNAVLLIPFVKLSHKLVNIYAL